MAAATEQHNDEWPFLSGGGEMAALIARHDWASTSVGPISGWPPSLKNTIALILRSPVPMVTLWNPDGVMIYNDGYAVFAGKRHPQLLGSKVREGWPEVADFNDNIMKTVLAGGTLAYREQELVLDRRGQMEQGWMDLDYSPVLDEAGSPWGVICIVVETTAKVKAERRVRGERERIQQMFRQAPGFMALLSGPDHVFDLVNPAYTQLVGHRDVRGKTVREALPELRGQGYYELLDKVYASGEAFFGTGLKATLQRAPGSPEEERFLDFVYQPLRDDDGKVVAIFVQGMDTTDRLLAEEAMRQMAHTLEQRVAERTASLQRTEAALQQAQKMETVGQLTGGVAHDFNNLLQVVAGNLQLLAKEVQGNARAERQVANALAGASRGAKLSSQLLAFARRQPLQPRVVRLGRLVAGMDEMLRRSIGDSVEIETVVSGGLWNTFADPAQVENVLLNLAINARDAMEGVGQLTIEVGNAHLDETYTVEHPDVLAGQYVMLAVTDTGCGMTPEVMAKAFEPFFSTKPEGKGTGLGLSMVYGFVKQSDGHVKIYSEPGHGTSVKLYLPRTLRDEDEATPAQPGQAEGGNETVLVAEDDDQVRATVVEMLRELGYSVMTARDASSALAIVESGAHIDLLFTDVVMPGPLRSPEMARRAQELLPNLAVLFTSGYTQNAIVHGGRLDPGVELLGKPYSQEALARKVRQVLANHKQRQLGRAGLGGLAAQPAVTPPPTQAPARALRILLVEDDPLVRSSTAELLEYLGHTVRAAAVGSAALSELQAQRFDLLFTDLGLPDMAGEALAALARRGDADIALVLASGAPLDRVPDRAVALLKPYDADSIALALEQAMALAVKGR